MLVQTLQGLVEMDSTDLDWEVVLVDNAGNDETARVPRIDLIVDSF